MNDEPIFTKCCRGLFQKKMRFMDYQYDQSKKTPSTSAPVQSQQSLIGKKLPIGYDPNSNPELGITKTGNSNELIAGIIKLTV